MSIVLNLPFPPSVHEVFRKHKGRHLSERYRKWRDDAGWLLKSQRPGGILGPVEISICLCAPDKRARDADNYNKGPLDLLVTHGVIEADDSRVVRSVKTEWVESQDFPCVVYIHAWPGPLSVGDPDGGLTYNIIGTRSAVNVRFNAKT